MHNFKRALLVMWVSLAGTACRQDAPPPAPIPPNTPPAADPWTQPTPQKQSLARPFLWSVEKDGKTTYMLGTMHRGVEAEQLPKLVWDKLDAAKVFAMETDVGDPSLAKMGARDNGTLRDDLGPDYWKKLELALPPDQLDAANKTKAWIAVAMISVKHLPSTLPMDGVLQGRALNQNKRIVYLEAATLQAAMLDKYMDVRMLKLLLDTHDKAPAQAKKMLDAYTAGDGEGLVALNDDMRADALAHGYSALEYEKSLDDLLYKRNASWVAPIEELHAAGGAFIAVGALHLVGPKNVLGLLERVGYKVTRVAP